MVHEDEIWRYVAPSDYTMPRDGSVETLRGVRRFWKAARAAWRSRDGEPDEESFDRAGADDLQDLLPPLEVDELVPALAAALGDWPAGCSSLDQTRVVVGPPGTATGEVVEALARRRGWTVAAAPERATLLLRDDPVDEALDGVEAGTDSPLVVPRLHRWLLRSERALPRLRRLLDRLRARRAPLLIGCDSWAWSFLAHTLGVGDLDADSLTLQALDGAALAAWLGSPLAAAERVCRSTEEPDRPVFAPRPEEESDGDGVSPTLVRLASAARGNPGTAVELWRRSLRVAKQENDGDAGRAADPATLWAAPLSRSETVVSRRLESTHKFVLHAVLVHSGLEPELLPEVLPFPRLNLSRWARDLAVEGLLSADGRLEVPQSAYAAVRDNLDSEGFLMDRF